MKMARLRGLACFLLLFFSLCLWGCSGLSIVSSGAEQDIEPLLKWVCLKMNVDFADIPASVYPEIVEMNEGDFYQFVKTIPIIERKFGKKVDKIVAIYWPLRNEIYIIKNSPRHYLVHELVHFIQFKIKRVFPEEMELNRTTLENLLKDLENEARSIELLYKKQARFQSLACFYIFII